MDLALKQQGLTVEQERILQLLIEAGHDEAEAREWVLTEVFEAEEKPRFTVTDESSANWVLRKLAECDAEESAIKQMADEEIERIKKRAEKLLSPIQRKRQFFEAVFTPQLEEFAKSRVTDTKRSVNLLHGKVGFRRGQEKLVIDDEEKAIIWAESECPDAVKVVKSLLLTPAKAQLLKQCPETKALAGIMHIEPAEDKFYVKAEMPQD